MHNGFLLVEFPFFGGKAEGQVVILREFLGSGRMVGWLFTLWSKKKLTIRTKNEVESNGGLAREESD